MGIGAPLLHMGNDSARRSCPSPRHVARRKGWTTAARDAERPYDARRRRDARPERVRYASDMTDQDKAFYAAWAELLGWMREVAEAREGVRFEKEGDFPDYIYRMERPYDLPTTVMSASLSLPDGRPVLLAYASPRHAVFKEVVVHPVDSHAYRKLTLAKDGSGLAEGARRFGKDRLEHLADELFALPRV